MAKITNMLLSGDGNEWFYYDIASRQQFPVATSQNCRIHVANAAEIEQEDGQEEEQQQQQEEYEEYEEMEEDDDEDIEQCEEAMDEV